MRYILLLLLFTIISSQINAQSQLNTKLIANLEYQVNLNDIWGYVAPNGTEYALVGTREGISIVSLENPAAPEEVSFVPGARSVWRDIKTHGDYAYAVADQGEDGLLIIDLSPLPDSTSHTFWKENITVNGVSSVMNRCHNLYIDNGYIYLSGCNNIAGITILDANDTPTNPLSVGAANLQYSHDVFVRDNLMFTSEINVGQLGIYDVSDKANPQFINTQTTSSTFTHNAWSSDDNQFVFTTDERPNASLEAFDISNLDQIEKIDDYQVKATKGNGVIPHNAHYHNDFLVNSWYTDGLVVLDASNPQSLVRVAQYDTWDGPDGGFNGCWGAYPFLPSGLVIASDISSGLFVIEVDYKRASFLKGVVTDEESNLPINGASIFFTDESDNISKSDPTGNFVIGMLQDGRVKAVISHPEYFTDTLTILLESQVTLNENIQLKRRNTTQLVVEVIDKETGENINDANLLFKSDETVIEGKTSAFSGNLSFEAFLGETEIITGKLGYKTRVNTVNIDETTTNIKIELERGIEDDFNFIYGWEINTTATTGSWQRNIPVGTFFQNLKSNPDTDSPDDIGDVAFVTGHRTTDVSDQDVDDGFTMLISPVFDVSDLNNPIMEYSLWFFNGAGAGSVPNDYMEVMISDGTDTVVVERLVDPDSQSGRWRDLSRIDISEYYKDPSTLQVFVKIEDLSPGHLVEGGFDNFAIVSGTSTSTPEIEDPSLTEVYPTFFADVLIAKSDQKIKRVNIYDMAGRLVLRKDNVDGAEKRIETGILESAIYAVEVITDDGKRTSSIHIKP